MFNLERTSGKGNQNLYSIWLLTFLLTLFGLTLIRSNTAQAISESEWQQNLEGPQAQAIISLHQFFNKLNCAGQAGIELHCAVFDGHSTIPVPAKVLNHALILVPGFTESASQYNEFVFDLYQLGFGPIYIYDHRGHGASGRLPGQIEMNAGTVDSANFYVEDFRTVVGEILDHHKKTVPTYKISLISHSMGSLVALSALSTDNWEAIHKHILIAPLVALNLGKPLNFMGSILGVSSLQNLLKLIGCPHTLFLGFNREDCLAIAPGAKYSFESQSLASKSRITSSQLRLGFHTRWRNDQKNQGWAEFQADFDGPSVRWVIEALGLTAQLPQKIVNYKKPSLALLAKQEMIVRNDAAKELFDSVNVNAKQVVFEIHDVEGKHALHIEADLFRDPLLIKISEFLNQP